MGLKEKLKGMVEHEKALWGKRDERKLKREKEKLAKLREEEKRLDEKLKRKRLQDRVKAKRREASPVYGILSSVGKVGKEIGKGLERVGEDAEGYTAELPSLDSVPKKKRKKTKTKSKKKKKTKKRDPFPELPPL